MKKQLLALSVVSMMLTATCPIYAQEETTELSPYGAYMGEGFSEKYWSEEYQKALAEKIEKMKYVTFFAST